MVVGDRPTVLVVDDDARNRALVCAALEDLYQVIEAPDGPDALRLLEQSEVDLVLLDVMMPEMSGFEVCKRIKQRVGAAFLPVILLTALNEQDDRNRGLGVGADDFLSKPVNLAELRLRSAAFLRLRQHERTIAAQLEKLRELDALKDDLVSLLVHDLRNPLAGIHGLLQVVREQVDDPDLAEDIALASKSSEQMRVALEDILRVRQLEEGRLALQREPQDLGSVVEEAAAAVGGSARDRGIQLKVSVLRPCSPRLDRPLVRRAVENVLMNAIKYSPRGGIVEAEVGGTDQLATVDVMDRGSGMSDQNKHALFEKFGGTGHRTSGRRGFGLGLYSVRLAIEAHGGSVAVSDAAGGGTVLHLELPAG
ncbi:MAG: hybrid sensor histidine kinase/response regulator [Myxococcales bacterium]|nr:hybrid sensor histidine kinase/response regulator [Myxococcales bacterium]